MQVCTSVVHCKFKNKTDDPRERFNLNLLREQIAEATCICQFSNICFMSTQWSINAQIYGCRVHLKIFWGFTLSKGVLEQLLPAISNKCTISSWLHLHAWEVFLFLLSFFCIHVSTWSRKGEENTVFNKSDRQASTKFTIQAWTRSWKYLLALISLATMTWCPKHSAMRI